MYDSIIDEYIKEVTEEMGAGQRAEVAKELRSHILDSADALAAEKKAPVDVSIMKEVLDKMGPAKELAAMYPVKKTLLYGIGNVVKGLGIVVMMFLTLALVIWLVAPDIFMIPGLIILNVVGALIIAIVVIAIILFLVNLYELRLKAPYGDRLRSLEKSLDDNSSPLKVWLTISCTIVWMVIINIFWKYIPFLPDFGERTVVMLAPLFTPDFAQFLPYINLLGVLTIGVQLLYLAMRQKWVPALMEAALGLASTLLIYWILTDFPFNPEFSSVILSGIRIFLAVVILLSIFSVLKQLWGSVKLFFGRAREEKGVA